MLAADASPTLKTERADVVVPFRIVLGSVLGLWACAYALNTLTSLLAGLPYQLEMAAIRMAVTLAGIILTLGLWTIIRLLDARPFWAKVLVALVVAFPIALAIAQINTFAFRELEQRVVEDTGAQNGVNMRRDASGNLVIDVPGMGGMDDPLGEDEEEQGQTITIAAPKDGNVRWQQLIYTAVGRYFLLLAWCALYFAILAGERARVAERNAGTFQQAARAAELRSLRYQVNPHFLFNTLNSLSSLILTERNEQAEEMVQTMANFYRQSLTDDPTADLPLTEEFALQRHYLDIESVRFPDRLVVALDLPPQLGEARVPGMILQPLVENSVKYGVANSTRPVRIAISAREEYGRLVLTVEDDGPGPGTLDEAGHGYGIGLENVRQRLEARYGDKAHMVSGPTGDGYATHVRIPLERNDTA